MDVNGIITSNKTLSKAVNDLKNAYPNSIKILKNGKNNASIISKFSFMMISYPTWNVLSESENRELASIPSTLIINKKPSRFNKTSLTGLAQTEFDYSEE